MDEWVDRGLLLGAQRSGQQVQHLLEAPRERWVEEKTKEKSQPKTDQGLATDGPNN